jgi:hypothetical protein
MVKKTNKRKEGLITSHDSDEDSNVVRSWSLQQAGPSGSRWQVVDMPSVRTAAEPAESASIQPEAWDNGLEQTFNDIPDDSGAHVVDLARRRHPTVRIHFTDSRITILTL